MPDTFDEEFTDFDEDFTGFDETLDEETHVEPTLPTEEPPKLEEEIEQPVEEEYETEEPLPINQQVPPTAISLNEIPLNVVIEVGRMQISVQKFLDLQPGNLLELGIHPENGVDLVVNGNVIGKGELIKIGDSLGVRIIDKA